MEPVQKFKDEETEIKARVYEVKQEAKTMRRPILHEYMTMLEAGYTLTDASWVKMLAALAKEQKQYEEWQARNETITHL